MIDKAAITELFRGWLKRSLALDDAHVTQADQSGNEPEGTYATVKVGTLRKLGATPAQLQATPASPVDGADLELGASHLYEGIATIQVAAKRTTGNTSGFTLLARACERLWLESEQAFFLAAKVGLSDVGPVLDLSAVRLTEYQGRATVDLTFYVSSLVSELTTYIETVTGTGTVDGDPIPYTLPP